MTFSCVRARVSKLRCTLQSILDVVENDVCVVVTRRPPQQRGSPALNIKRQHGEFPHAGSHKQGE